MQLPRLRNPAERASSRQAGLGIGQPPTLVLVLEDTEVRRQLAFELGLSAVRLEEMDETKQESSNDSHRYGSLSRRASTNPARRRHRSVSFASARIPASGQTARRGEIGLRLSGALRGCLSLNKRSRRAGVFERSLLNSCSSGSKLCVPRSERAMPAGTAGQRLCMI